MSSEGDSTKNLSSEAAEKNDAESTDSSQDGKDAKPEVTENNVEKKKEDESEPKTVVKESSDEVEKKTEKDKQVESKVSDSNKGNVKQQKDEKSDSKEDEESSEKDEKDSEEGGDDEKEVPLLDQPLEKSGKRERKNVQRFNEEFASEGKEPTKVDVPDGSGTSLGDIPRVDASISRFKNDDLKLLHRILFKTPGKNTMVKRNIKKFNGFDFKKDSEEYTKKVSSIQKCEVKQLKSVCEMLDLPKTGNRDELADRILEFLIEPKDSGKPVGGGRPKRTAAVRANNRGYSSHDNYSSDEKHGGRTTRDKGKRPNLKDDSSSASDEDFEPSDDGSDEKPRVTKKRGRERKKPESDDDDASEMEESASSDEDSDFQDEPKSKRKKSVKVNNKSKGKGAKRGRKPAAATKKAPKGKKKKSSSDEEDEESDHKDEDGSSSEDEPLAKKAKAAQPPTDDEIKTYVKEILEGANLEQITMKTVCQQVYAHYPDFDLAHKKDFIKTTVKSLIST